MTLFYIFRHIKRSAVLLIVVAMVLILAVLASGIQYTLAEQKEKLVDLEENFSIWAEISDIYGKNTDNLNITNSYIWFFTHENSKGYGLFEKLCLKWSMPADIANAEIDSSGSDSETDISPQENPQPRSGTPALVGITQQESDIELLPENGVAIGFVEGYSWDDFGMDSTDAICLVPIGTPIDSDGNIQISVKNSEAVTLAVAGIVYGGNPDKIYCPWRYLINTFEGGMEWSQSFRATIIDNKRLAEIKEKMKTAFTYADPMHPGTEYSYAMTIFDSQYMSSHKSVSQNIALLTAAQPIFLIIDIIIGFMTGFLLLRQRRKEYALFRAIGCGKAGAISLLLLEYTIICIFSAAIYSVSAIFITAVQSGFAYLPFVIICFIMGIFAAEIVIMRDSALKSLQTNE